MNLSDYLIDQAGLLARIYQQTKDLPDGTPITAVITQ